MVGRLPDQAIKAQTVETMFDHIAGRYDLLNALMTFGLDARWRRRAVRELRLPRGSLVVDLACGTGDFCEELQRQGLCPLGVDFAAEMLAHAHTRAPLVRADILHLPLHDGAMDGAVCGFALRNVVDIGACFAETARVLRPDGRAAFLEVAQPRSPLVRSAHSLYFNRVVPALGALISDRRAYEYLPASVAYLPGSATMLRMLQQAGFRDARCFGLAAGAVQLLTATRRAA